MLTPLDIQKKEFRRRLRGYSEDEVDQFLDQILEDYEMLYRQNASLEDEAGRLQEEAARYRELEDTLKDTLVLSQRAADETKTNAQKAAELIVAEAHAKARILEEESRQRLSDLAINERELRAKIFEYKAQARAFLNGAISLLEGPDQVFGIDEQDNCEQLP